MKIMRGNRHCPEYHISHNRVKRVEMSVQPKHGREMEAPQDEVIPNAVHSPQDSISRSNLVPRVSSPVPSLRVPMAQY